MIAYLTGTLFTKTPRSVIVENNGIGYEVIVPLSTFYALPEQDESVSLHIHTHVREDALTLFGFQSPLEKDIFLMLISVSGIGPKLAINILSGIGPDELLGAMALGDAVRLQTIPGVGRKTAERIALELCDRASAVSSDLSIASPPAITDDHKRILDDALSALLNLGYPAKSAKKAVDRATLNMNEVNLEGLIKEALKLLT